MMSREYINNDTSINISHDAIYKLDRLLRILAKPSIQLSTVIFTQRLCLPIIGYALLVQYSYAYIGIMHTILKQINKLVTQVTKRIIFIDRYLKLIKMLILFLFAVLNIQKIKK